MAISTIWIKRTFCSFMALMEINVPFLPHVGVSTHKRLDPWIPYLVSWSMDPKSVGTKSWYRHRWIPWYHDQQWVWLIRRIPILWVWFIRRWDNIPWWLIGVITWYIVLHTTNNEYGLLEIDTYNEYGLLEDGPIHHSGNTMKILVSSCVASI